jgi:hypothetical protein
MKKEMVRFSETLAQIKLHSAVFQKTAKIITAAAKTSNPISLTKFGTLSHGRIFYFNMEIF